MKIRKKITLISAATVCLLATAAVPTQSNIAEEVAWMIGDQPIYKSEIEEIYREYQQDRVTFESDPYCVIPEMLAVQRLFLHQADLDTLEAPSSTIASRVDAQINFLISQLGSKEKVEQYMGKSMQRLREDYTQQLSDRYRVDLVKDNLTKNVKVTPADVRRYYDSMPQDSVPAVPLQVEVQIITIKPVIPQQEIDDVKARLRDFADRVRNGETDFSTLAILYSQDPGSARQGGELGFMGRAQLVPEFAAVAFNLNDPKKVSNVVETEFGYHIIQLIEKRGDRVNTRHILLQPKVDEKDLTEAVVRLDSLRTDIVDKNLVSFEEAARRISQDKDTRYSNGVMVNPETGSVRFKMSDLPSEVVRAVSTLEPGGVSDAFIMKNAKSNTDQVAIVKLTARVPAHKANLSDDYELIKNMYENYRKEQILDEWLAKKIKETYVRIEDGWRGCDFEHEGWINR